MKKTLVSALTTALVVGAASTTFAAANPFADVPADHWAYDAVSELQAKGVVNGYAVDNTFRGNQNMTRYEMAQIVAKAMAKVESGDAATKAMVDKLAAEFRDELANLGVRMDDLEARMDNVKHSGFIRYRYQRDSGNGVGDKAVTDHFLRFRLNSAVKINKNVDGYARVEWNHDVDRSQDTDRGADIQRLWVHGKVGTTDIYAGKINPHDNVVSLGHGLMLDDVMTGAQVTFNKGIKNGKVSWTIDAGKTTAGAFGREEVNVPAWAANVADTVPVSGAQTRLVGTHVDYQSGNFDAAIGYYNFSNKYALENAQNAQNFNSWGVWGIGLGYKFGKDFYLTGDYTRASEESIVDGRGQGKNAYNIQLNYKGAKESVAKSWGAYVGYERLSPTASPFPTYDARVGNNVKGWKIGVDYTFMKNVVGSIQYFDGKRVNGEAGNDKTRRLFTQLTFSF